MTRKRKNSQKAAVRRGSSARIYRVLVALMLAALAVMLLREFGRFDFLKPRRDAEAIQRLRAAVVAHIENMGLRVERPETTSVLQVRLPVTAHPLTVFNRISNLVADFGGRVTDGVQDASLGGLSFQIVWRGRTVDRVRLLRDPNWNARAGRIALVIDDFGYKLSPTVEAFLEFPVPITYAVIPGLPFSREIAERLHRAGRVVIIHMPMEPLHGRVENDGYTLFTHLQPNEVQQRVRRAIEAVPFAVGMNNHMGSRATMDTTLLEAAFAEVKAAGLFFIDSRTSQQSVAFELAKQAGIPALENTLFLDAVNDSAHVVQKLLRLSRRARKRGFAVGIGHPRPATLAALQEWIPLLQVQGFEFVTTADLVGLPRERLP